MRGAFVLLSVLCLTSPAIVASTPVIHSASINYVSSPHQLLINGSGFDPRGTAPTVDFNGAALGSLVSFSDSQIVASLPNGLSASTYRIKVTNSQGNSVGFDLTYGLANLGSARSFFLNNFPIAPSADQAHGVLVDWNNVQYDTLNAVQVHPWKFVAPSDGRYRVVSFIRYSTNGTLTDGQLVQVEVYLNGGDYGSLGGFQVFQQTSRDIFITGEDELPCHAGDQITVNLFQNTGFTGAVTTASHVLVERLGDL